LGASSIYQLSIDAADVAGACIDALMSEQRLPCAVTYAEKAEDNESFVANQDAAFVEPRRPISLKHRLNFVIG